MGAVFDKLACCKPGPPLKRGGSQYGSQGSLDGAKHGSHSIMRSSPLTDFADGPKLREFILVPWILAVIVLLIAIIACGRSWIWVVVPPLIVCGVCAGEALTKYKKKENHSAIFYLLCCVGGFAAFMVSMITYIHFLRPYNQLGGGATYLDMLPSQSAAGAADATAIVFAEGTSINDNKTYGFVDARNPTGTMYCVAPVSNKWTIEEPGVQFFAAGINCCGKRSGFGCGEGGLGRRGALIMQSEETADPGFKKAVEGAAVQYNLQPGNGYLLLDMVVDPIAFRNDKYDSAVKLVLIYIVVYLVIAAMTGFMAFNVASKPY